MVARRALRRLRRRWPTLALAGVAGGAVLAVALVLFPYHSVNHDEGVYLQQAAMLLEGRLRLHPPVDGAFRPWFFVDGPEGLYAKYSPVVPAMFAVGLLVGEPRVALAVVAAGSAALLVALGDRAFDRATGLAAGGLLLSAPLFVFTAATFLPYAPTFLLNLGFAYAYVRAVRERSVRWAALAGGASGTAFFARPYTAVLFAAPFAVHALWTLWRQRRAALRLYAALCGTGLAMVGVTLGYNAALTGDPLLFPYEAFAPLDGLGFGERRILEHSMEYTPARALTANGYLLWYLATRWAPLGAVGTVLAVAGVGLARSAPDDAAGTWLSDRHLRAVLAGVAVSVAVGNLYFWGNANVLATPADPRDGLVAGFGPFYHFDVLLPLSVFGGYALVRGGRALCEKTAELPRTRRRALAVAALVVVTPVVGGAAAASFGPPLEQHAGHADAHAQAYEPLEPAPPRESVVLLPTPYGPWLNHPFQYLRNDPGFDGETVYATDDDPETTWAVADAYPDRTLHRYRYRGAWTPSPETAVEPTLRATERVGGDSLGATTTVGLPEGATSATVAVATDDETERRTVTPEGETLAVEWRVADGRLESGDASVGVDGPTRAEVSVVVVGAQGGTVAYEVELLVRPTGGSVEALWPPARQVCLAATTCDDAYVPDSGYPSFVEIETERRSERRSSRPTFRMDVAISAPPVRGSSFVSPARSA